MELNFIILQGANDDASVKTSFSFKPAGGVIGRNNECDWVMPSSERAISNQHAVISYHEGIFYITDISTNGIELLGENSSKPPKNKAQEIEHGDIYLIGNVQIQAALVQEPGFYLDRKQPLIPNDIFLDEQGGSLLDQIDTQHEVPEDNHNMLDQVDMLQNTITTPTFKENSADPLKEYRSEQPEQQATSNINRSEDGDALRQVLEKSLGVKLAEGTDLLGHVETIATLLIQSISGTQHLLRTRADIKNELRCQMTQVETQDNNPLKFTHNPQEVLDIILHKKSGYLSGEKAIELAAKDLQAHQVAMNNACQNMFDELLIKLSPEILTYLFVQQGKEKGFGKPDARFWRAYSQYHRNISKDPDWRSSLIEQAFAKHYEAQLNLFAPLSKM